MVTDRNGDEVKEDDTILIHFPEKLNSPGILYKVLAFNKAIPLNEEDLSNGYRPLDISFIKKERILLW